MALLEDPLKNHALAVAGLGLFALILPLSSRKGWVTVLTEGLKLYLEANGEAESELVDELAVRAFSDIVEALGQPKDERAERIEHIVGKFEKRARTRAGWWASNDADREACYRRHHSNLRSKITARHARASDEQQSQWEAVLKKLGQQGFAIVPQEAR